MVLHRKVLPVFVFQILLPSNARKHFYWKIFANFTPNHPDNGKFSTNTPSGNHLFIQRQIGQQAAFQTGKRLLLSARVSKNPGQFKDKNNRAGDSFFVDHLLVKGTLIKGFDYYQALSHPFARAVYLMFLISEIHPFLDGNGRMARVMMNAELVKQGQAKIIIPTVYRDDYMTALRRLTRQHDPAAYLRMLQRAHEFSGTIAGEDMDAMKVQLERSNAFRGHEEAGLLNFKKS